MSEYAWTDEVIARFLLAARCEPGTWDVVNQQSTTVQEAYWKGVYCIPLSIRADQLKCGIKLLLAHGNGGAALRSILHREGDFEATEIAEIIEVNFSSRSDALKELALHNVTELVKALERSPEFDRQRLLRLEFQLSVAFGQFAAEVMSELHRELVSDPEQLLFVTRKHYKSDTPGDGDDRVDEPGVFSAFENILFYTKMMPGVERDGSFSEPKAREFVERYLKLAIDAGYTKASQWVLGKLLAYAPHNDNGSWPPAFVCEVLDRHGHEEMRGTFEIEVLNKRGVTCRSPYDGGSQERTLADEYRRYAEACQIEYPLASHTLLKISQYYERDALDHDRDAESAKERF